MHKTEHHPLDQPAAGPQEARAPGLGPLAPRLRQGLVITLGALTMGLSAAYLLRTPQAGAPGASSAAARPPRHADFGAEPASPEVRFIANWASDSGDNDKLPFVIIDKKNTRAFVFDPAGKLLGAAPVLLGAASGDESVPGIGQRPLAQVLPQERTTPAGRFVGEPGRNLSGEDIVWVDYDAAVSMHRVRTANKKERRLERLASPTTADNRISFGCINMPAAFYENVLSPQFRSRHGVIYVLPDTKPVRQVFASAYDPSARYRATIAAGRQAAATAGNAPARLLGGV
jgi:hypothetical protein